MSFIFWWKSEEVEEVREANFNGVTPGIVIVAMFLNKWGILLLLVINLGILFSTKRNLEQCLHSR